MSILQYNTLSTPMYVTVHSTIGAGLGKFIPNPFLAFIVGALCHFLCDFIPHGDSSDHLSEAEKKKRMIYVFVFDSFAWIIILGMIFLFAPLANPMSMAMGALGGLFPDLLRVPYLMFQWKPLKTYCAIHDTIHKALHYDIPALPGIIEQSIVLAIFLAIIFT